MNKALEGAKKKGYQAGLEGKTIRDCPYEDRRAGPYDNIVTWSRGFIHAWIEGMIEGNEERQKRLAKEERGKRTK